jgi:hypothetical protein
MNEDPRDSNQPVADEPNPLLMTAKAGHSMRLRQRLMLRLPNRFILAGR